ncbi:hypothetical protein [Klebsiella oxytoca]|uniref:hypothetical protein n=1 Tax=Klebsiella oxytoca TaxID=571 RepID=UPI001E3F173E|nr:hypothetical protein [Klebsiella oxytoca]HBM3111125.1 hypothetical protein [Klebsiella oxytoca]HCQ8441170.1 hypothetical protein [Klebsiella oxytoca]
MELTPAQITEGMIFYGVKSGSDFPEFSKYEAIKATNKQVKAKKAKTSPWGVNYEYTLRESDWQFFTDFISAREVWVATVLDPDIKRAEGILIASQKRKALMLAATDL